MRRSGAACAAAAAWVMLAGSAPASSVPSPFLPLTTQEAGGVVDVGLWGRSYRFSAGPLPSQVRSQGMELFVGPPRFRFVGAQGAQEIEWQPPTILWAGEDMARLRSVGRLPGLRVYADTRVEYDGMIAVELTLTAERLVRVGRLEYELELARGAARYFARHLPYDYQVANVDKSRLLEAAGWLRRAGLALDFVPSLALGNRQVGIEWWSETNAHWSPLPGVRPFEVVRDADAVRLRVTPISARLALAAGSTWRDAFALFVFPARPPPERWRSVRFLPYNRAGRFDPQVGTRFVFLAMQDTFHARYDGLPASIDDAFQRERRADLRRRGVGYMPYGILTLAPILHPRTLNSFELWSADGKWWRLQEDHNNLVIQRNHPELGAGAPYGYAACAARRDYFDWILDENLGMLRAEDPDAFYFDHGAITRMCVRNPVLDGKSGRESWEYRNVRDFYKRLYESVKAEAPDALIVIHTHGAPKALGAFVDFHMIGEALNAVFGGDRPATEYFADPSLYTPDYLALPPGYLDAQLFPPVGGVATLIPQIRYAIDPEQPERVRRFQRAFQALVLSNDAYAPLWSSDPDTVDEIYQALDRFGGLGSAVIHPWWSNAGQIRRPAGLRATAWIRDGRALLVLANLGDAPLRGQVVLDLQTLSLRGARRHRDLERPELPSGALQGGGFAVDVPPRDLRIFLVE